LKCGFGWDEFERGFGWDEFGRGFGLDEFERGFGLDEFEWGLDEFERGFGLDEFEWGFGLDEFEWKWELDESGVRKMRNFGSVLEFWFPGGLAGRGLPGTGGRVGREKIRILRTFFRGLSSIIRERSAQCGEGGADAERGRQM
jgi:hypothetical protein